jgi:hypothetical protein
MERAGKLMGKWKLSRNCTSQEEIAKAAWPVAVGKRVASHTGGVKLVRSSLVVEVEDDIWRRQLFSLRGQILKRLEDVLGEGIVTDIEFRTAVPRRLPQREERPWRRAEEQSALPGDEADRIEDPVLRRSYKAARRRRSA